MRFIACNSLWCVLSSASRVLKLKNFLEPEKHLLSR
jgi:hypothetical protein